MALLGLPGATQLCAQDLDSRGREFWVTFMANNGSGQGVSDLLLYISAPRATTGTITWAFNGQSIPIDIPVANQTVEINISGLFGTSVELDDTFWDARNEVTPKGVHIEAEDEVAVVGLNYRQYSCDAFLGLPTDVLTGEYVVVSHRNGQFGNASPPNYDMPSEFAVVGTQDGTTVRVVPTAGLVINERPDDPFTIALDAGDVFFGQASLDGPSDVSGTQIIANKPVAVFAGVKRTSIPATWGNYRDHLVEQLPPIQSWGRNALVTPHFPVWTGDDVTPEYRVTAAFGPTDVTITGSSTSRTYTLGAGEVLEQPLVEAESIVATGPILVAQYERSTPLSSGTIDGLGDPFMMLIPPVEQFDTAYTVQSIGYARLAPNAHYLNVVAPIEAMNSLTIDGVPTAAANWKPVPGSRFLYTQVNVRPGSHTLRADSPFAVYAYGYGIAVSYGYPGAMVFRRLVLDVTPPDVTWTQHCGLFQGIASDSRISDSGIDSLYATSDTVNVVVSIPPFDPEADTVFFSAHLVDPYNDGLVAIRVVDSMGLAYTQSVDIPGFTLGVNGQRHGTAMMTPIVAINTDSLCRLIPIVNYGRFQQRLVALRLVDSTAGVRITSPTPVTIDPGDTMFVEICLSALGDTLFTTLLELEGTCASRQGAFITIDSRVDTTVPGIVRQGGPCSDEVIVTYSKPERASNIASIDVDTTVNCSVEIINDPTTVPLQSVSMRVRRDDPRFDMIYAVRVVDSAGNIVLDRDTVGGFTVAAVDEAGDSLGIRWERAWEGDTVETSTRVCDSVMIVNYGSRDVTLTAVRLSGNVYYSAPPSQFPITVRAGGSEWIEICIEPRYPDDLLDTLELLDACAHREAIPLKTPSSALLGSAADDCVGRIEVSVYEAAKKTFMTTPVPNPTTGDGWIDIGLTRPESVTIELSDMRGNRSATLARDALLPAGVFRLTFALGPLDAGAYLVRMRLGDGTALTQQLLLQR